MKKKVSLVAVLLALGMFQAAFGQGTTTNVAPEIKENTGYLVGPGDVITGKVLGESQFDFTATIDEDGKFQVPFFEKSVMAKCKTDKELRADVTKLLSKYLKDPLVSVTVTERKSRPITSVFGEVRQPQNFEMRRKAKLLEMISQAGGTTEDAGTTVQVFRTQAPMCAETYEDTVFVATNDGSGVPMKTYDLSDVKKGVESSNPVIIPGDIIIVQKSAPIYITGQVVAPAGLHIPQRGLSLQQAIAMVGGVSPQAKTKDIRIFRLKPNSTDIESRDIISVNYDNIKKGTEKDVLLHPYDIIEVDKSKKSVAQVVFETLRGVGVGVLNTAPTRILY